MIKRLLILLLMISSVFGDYEDFSSASWVIYDTEGTKITKTSSTKVSWTDIQQDLDKYCYKDFGANHFAGGSDHVYYFDMWCNNVAANTSTAHWMMSNKVDDMKGIDDGSGSDDDFIAVINYDNGANLLVGLRVCINGSASTVYYTGAENTVYYLKVTHTGSTGVYHAYIYGSAADRTASENLLADLSRTDTDKNGWRYVFSVNNSNDNYYTRTEDGFTQNMDLGESYASMPVIVNNHRRMR